MTCWGVAALAVLVACAPARTGGERGSATDRRAEREETVVGTVDPDGTFRADTLSGARADTARVERETVMTGTVAGRGGSRAEAAARALAGRDAWQVQVFAATGRAEADAYAARIADLVDGEPVTVEWIDPWWKVRVGAFSDREAADVLRARLVGRGLTEAWTVRGGS